MDKEPSSVDLPATRKARVSPPRKTPEDIEKERGFTHMDLLHANIKQNNRLASGEEFKEEPGPISQAQPEHFIGDTGHLLPKGIEHPNEVISQPVGSTVDVAGHEFSHKEHSPETEGHSAVTPSSQVIGSTEDISGRQIVGGGDPAVDAENDAEFKKAPGRDTGSQAVNNEAATPRVVTDAGSAPPSAPAPVAPPSAPPSAPPAAPMAPPAAPTKTKNKK